MAPSKRSRVPSYRLHKSSGQAVVTLDGKDHYLGPHGSERSRAEYDRLIAEWLSIGRRAPVASAEDALTIDELVVRYWEFAGEYYPSSARTNELENMRYAIRPLRKLYGQTVAGSFGPKALKSVRDHLIEANLSRRTINARIGRIKRIFRWAVENELVPSSTLHGLQAVRGLPRGRSAARESEPVRPVPSEDVEAVLPQLSRQLQAIVRLMDLTAMRVGEVVKMRLEDIDRNHDPATGVWAYCPPKHKTAHHGHERVVLLGRRAQELLKPFLVADPDACLFSPHEAERERLGALGQGVRRVGNSYRTHVVRKAIDRACVKAGVRPWHPHQLRHSAATRLRKAHGLDAARVLLGHRSPAITEVYAEIDRGRALQIVARDG